MLGAGTGADPFIIQDVNDLQNMDLNLAAFYELGNDIDALAITQGPGLISSLIIGSYGRSSSLSCPTIISSEFGNSSNTSGSVGNSVPVSSIC